MGFIILSTSPPTILTTNTFFIPQNMQTCVLHPKELATCIYKLYMVIRKLYWGGFSDIGCSQPYTTMVVYEIKIQEYSS